MGGIPNFTTHLHFFENKGMHISIKLDTYMGFPSILNYIIFFSFYFDKER